MIFQLTMANFHHAHAHVHSLTHTHIHLPAPTVVWPSRPPLACCREWSRLMVAGLRDSSIVLLWLRVASGLRVKGLALRSSEFGVLSCRSLWVFTPAASWA